MKRFKFLLFAFILTIPFSVNALEENTCEVFEKGNYSYTTLEEANIKKDWLEAKVESLNNGDGIFGDFRFSYTIDEEEVPYIEKTNLETIEVSKEFVSKEEAIKHYEDIALDGYVMENPKVTEHKEPTFSQSKETSVICTSSDCMKEKQEILDALLPNQKVIFTDITYKTEFGKEYTEEYKENGEVYYFDSEKEALEFMKDYKPSKDGYQFDYNTLEKETVSTQTKEEYEEVFDTLEEANNALEEFSKNHSEVSSSIEKIRDESEDTKENGSYGTYNKTEYDNWIKNNVYEDENGKLTYTEKEPVIKNDTISIDKEFTSEALAIQYIESLEKDGYTVSAEKSYDYELTGVENAIKIDKGQVEYTFSKDKSDYILIKQGQKGDVAVWTLNELTDDEKANFVTSYNEESSDGSTNNLTVDSVEWISGYGAFDLSTVFGDNWGTYTFIDNGNNITLTTGGKVSHVVYGTSLKENYKWYLKGSASRQTTYYSLDYTNVTYGFDYKVKASGVSVSSSLKYKVVSHFKEIIKIPTFTYHIETLGENIYYILSYDRYIPVEKIMVNVNWQILKCKKSTVDDDFNEENINKDEDSKDAVITVRDYPNPPQTGVKKSIFNICNLLLVLLLLLVYRFYRVVKDN